MLKRSAKTNGWSRRWFVLNEKTGKVLHQQHSITCYDWHVVYSCTWDVYSSMLFFFQFGYTKKQEERHFRGVITLEVCPILLSTIQLFLLNLERLSCLRILKTVKLHFLSFPMFIFKYCCIYQLLLTLIVPCPLFSSWISRSVISKKFLKKRKLHPRRIRRQMVQKKHLVLFLN